MCFIYSTPRKISQGLECIWDSLMGGTPSSATIIQDVDLVLNVLEIFYRANGAAIRGYRIELVTEGKR